MITLAKDKLPTTVRFREITKETFEAFGYRVRVVSEGTEAVAFYAQNKEKIQVRLLDMILP